MKHGSILPWVFILVSPLFVTPSCDILRSSPFQVVAWAPGAGYKDNPRSLDVSLQFSHPPDRSSVEGAFSCTEEGSPLGGSFRWDDDRLHFVPHTPFAENRDYRLTLGTDAQDREGLSLERPFEGTFSTRLPGDAPRVLGCSIRDGEVLDNPPEELRLEFSTPVTLGSCESFISFNPGISGRWEVGPSGREIRFVAQELWRWGTPYTLTVASDFTDAASRRLFQAYHRTFTVGTDTEGPSLGNVQTLVPPDYSAQNLSFSSQDGQEVRENTDWETFYSLGLQFSEPVDADSLKSHLTLFPSTPWTLVPPSGKAVAFRVEFPQKLSYGEGYLFTLRPGLLDGQGNGSTQTWTWRLRVNGKLSKPPTLRGLRLPLDPRPEAMDQSIQNFSVEAPFAPLPLESGGYPYGVGTPTWVEFFFDTAETPEGQKRGVDPFSFIDAFRLETTNGAFSFIPLDVGFEKYTPSDPPLTWANCVRIYVRGTLTNQPSSGLALFRIGSGLRDTGGNVNTEETVLPLTK